jgi:methyl-accepting chemotaxis protein
MVTCSATPSASGVTSTTQELAAQAQVAEMASTRAAKGDFSMPRLALDDSNAFVRQIGEGLNGLASMVEQAVADFDTALSRIADGDLTVGLHADCHGAFRSLEERGIRRRIRPRPDRHDAPGNRP